MPILQIDADRTGGDDLGDVFRHLRRLTTIALLYIGGQRYAQNARHARGGRDHFGPWRNLSVRIAQRPIDAAAGGGNGIETSILDDPSRQRIPRIGEQEQGWRSVTRPEGLGKM